MSPDQEFNQMKQDITTIKQVMDVPFIENIKRRAVNPRLVELGLTKAIIKVSEGNTSGVLQSVNEGGSGSYSVAAEFDGTLTVQDADGNTYKLGYYTA